MIGILDSGIGGLSVYAEIVRLMPKKSIYYYADTAHCPYGERSDEEIIRLSMQCVDYLVNQGVQIVVIACNTITSVAGQALREHFDGIDIVGMEPAIKPAALESNSKVVGVLATRATLRTDKYHNTRDSYAKGVEVIEIAGEGLVELVEGGNIDSKQSEELVGKYIGIMERAGADSVVLGCTHYPFLKDVISRVSTRGIKIIDPSYAVARRVKDVLLSRGLSLEDEGFTEEFYSSKYGSSSRVKELARGLRANSLRVTGRIDGEQ